MPGGVPRIEGIWKTKSWKTNGEGAKVGPRTPPSFADELIKGFVQHGTVYSLLERRIAVVAKPDERLRPGRGIVRIARQVAPHDGATLVGKLPRKGAINPDKSILNELLDLRVAKHFSSAPRCWQGCRHSTWLTGQR